jgi:excisionase family DNA binding protein
MDLLTKADAAKRLNVTPQTVRNMVERGELPAIRTERGWRLFRLRDVERLVAKRARASRSASRVP